MDFRYILIAGLLLVAASIEAVKIKDCARGKKGAATIESIAIAGCDLIKDEVCTFRKGTNATFKVDFVAGKYRYKDNLRYDCRHLTIT